MIRHRDWCWHLAAIPATTVPAGGVAAPEDEYHPKAGVYVANSSWGEFAGYSASIVANKSIGWLREVAGKGKPFMLTVSPTILPVLFRAPFP